jgi:drug/metabolite transporter (DMT)-like permease
LPLLVGRGLLGIGGLTFFFYAIANVPLSVAALLNWSSPVFVLLFSRAFLGESLRREAYVWFVLAVVGLVILMQGDALLGQSELVTMKIPVWGLLAGLVGAAFAGLAYVSVRALTDRIEPVVIVFYFTVTTTIVVFPFAMLEWVWPSNLEETLGLLAVGVFAGGGQYFMTLGYRAVQAPVASTLSLMSAVFASLYGYFLFDERMSPIQWSGMAVLGVSVLLLVLRSRRPKTAIEQSSEGR